MLSTTLTYLSEFYNYYANNQPAENLAATKNTNDNHTTNVKKRAINFHPEYLNILEPFNSKYIEIHNKTKNLRYSRLSESSNANVVRVFQNTTPTEKLKLQYNMIKKVSKTFDHPLNAEAHVNKISNQWVHYSYFSPYTLIMKNTGTDLATCIHFWENSKNHFVTEQLEKLDNNSITQAEYDESITKYNLTYVNTIRIIFKQIIEQLIFLNKRNFFYFDIKPQNITIDGRGIASLIDLDCKFLGNLDTSLEKQRFSGIAIALPYFPPDHILYPQIGVTYKTASWCLGMNLLLALDKDSICLPIIVSEAFPSDNQTIGDLKFNELAYKRYISYIKESIFLDSNAKDLIIKLLDLNPLTRLSLSEIMQHPFFSKELCRQDIGIFVERQKLFDELCKYESYLEDQQKNKVINTKVLEDCIQAKEQEIDFLDDIIANRRECSKLSVISESSGLNKHLNDFKNDLLVEIMQCPNFKLA